ncbi:helix-turn-helix domain-containing protein [Streptomyces sp. ID01-12c]|uniref:helix-turn-helix domain-containing protein n=1 Tax=Streptomyces caniscabiei TaxID=2746961 RepID=UPI001783E432|nr:helix-turn-helix transcriptional regulator [Streptomyces caniscabiei]MBD9701282.1 helix-turn-helix domain-containing protein [Streptomyces caniscabiei]MDX3726539.1 helix-turn-helix transcriptional regulator [Streptomyces caniscabiei]
MSIRDDAEEFAAELRRLKDTTDLSYGALARRLDMNVSTLHRYCAGEGVPKDFAPVERLATFCGATPEERLELHRLWLSAVAARQRVRTAAAPETAEAPEAVLPVQAVQEGLPTPAATPTPAPDTPGDGIGDGRKAGDTSGAGAGNGDDDPTVADRLRRRRRRRVLASASACALLVITGASLSALSDDDSSEADASRSAGPRTTAPGAPGRSTQPPATQPSKTAPADLPLTWNVDALVWDKGCDHDYVIDKPTARVPPPPLQQDAEAWASSLGAVHGRQTKVRISVQGRSSAAVVLEALHVRVVSRGTPVDGNAYSMGQGCGSDLTPRRFTVDLDEDRPAARPKDGANGADGGRVIPAVRFPFRVSAEDPEVLDVDATTQTYDARWYLELDWSSQGRAGTIRIDDDGRPFHTTGIKGMPHYWYGTNDAGERAWVPLDGQ